MSRRPNQPGKASERGKAALAGMSERERAELQAMVLKVMREALKGAVLVELESTTLPIPPGFERYVLYRSDDPRRVR